MRFCDISSCINLQRDSPMRNLCLPYISPIYTRLFLLPDTTHICVFVGCLTFIIGPTGPIRGPLMRRRRRRRKMQNIHSGYINV